MSPRPVSDEGPPPDGDGREFDLLVVGELNPDIVVSDPTAGPVFSQTETIVSSIRLEVGSSSAICACGAARLGLRTAFVGVVGDDTFGRVTLRALEDRYVDVTRCLVDPTTPTGATVILNRGLDRAILTATGAISLLSADDVPIDLLASVRHLHVGGTYLQPRLAAGLPQLFEAAHRAGVTTSFDCNWDPTESWNGGIDDILRVADVFLPNEVEALRITRTTDVGSAIDKLVETVFDRTERRRPFTLAIKQGADGAVAVHHGANTETARSRGLTVEVVDTIGAGDSFNAGFLYGFVHGWPLSPSLRLATACGSLSTTGPGGTSAQPTLAAAERAAAKATD